MTVDLDDVRIVTASAYAGMMAPLTGLPSAVCSMTGDTDTDDHRSHLSRLSLEALDGVRRRWRLDDLGRLADFVPKVVAQAPRDPRPVVVVPPRVTPLWADAAASWPDQVRLLGPPARDLARLADDKIFIRDALGRLGVPVPDSVVVPTPDLVDEEPRLARWLGRPFVVQAPEGAGGRGTYLVESRSQLAAAVRAQPQVAQWLVSRYAGDITINVSGVVGTDRVDVFPASVQASGIGELGAGYGAYCGSDFGAVAALSPTALAAAGRWTERIGAWLHQRGHRGIFGADVAVNGDAVGFLEVNPRIQGSSWLLSQLQRRHGRPECLVEHVRAQLGLAGAAGDTTLDTLGSGAHLLVRWTGPAAVVLSVPTAGTYRIRALGTRVTVTGLPRSGTLLAPGAIVARLESVDSLAVAGGSALRPEVADFVTGLRCAFEVTPVRDGVLRPSTEDFA